MNTKICKGSFLGGEIEPGTFHCGPEIFQNKNNKLESKTDDSVEGSEEDKNSSENESSEADEPLKEAA